MEEFGQKTPVLLMMVPMVLHQLVGIHQHHANLEILIGIHLTLISSVTINYLVQGFMVKLLTCIAELNHLSSSLLVIIMVMVLIPLQQLQVIKVLKQ